MIDQPPPVAYDIADYLIALLGSDCAAQETAGMEVTEFREWLATKMADVLDGVPAPPRRSSSVTDGKARAMLESAPVNVRLYYERRRSCGAKPAEAFDDAARLLRANATHD